MHQTAQRWVAEARSRIREIGAARQQLLKDGGRRVEP